MNHQTGDQPHHEPDTREDGYITVPEPSKKRNTIGSIHAELGIPLKSLKSEVDVLRSGGEIGPESDDSNDVKAERFEISALFIEEIWKGVEGWIKEHPPGFGVEEREQGAGARILHPCSESMVVSYLSDSGYAMRGIVNELDDFTKDVIHHMVSRVTDEQERIMNEVSKRDWTPLTRAYARLQENVQLGDNAAATESAASLLSSGVNTARHVIWSSFEIIPAVFERQFGRAPTVDELSRIIDDSRSTITSLASSHFTIFGMIMDLIGGRGDNELRFQESFFEIRKDGTKIEMVPVLPSLKRYKEEVVAEIIGKPRFGCAALYAKDSSGKNVVDAMYDWFASLTKKYAGAYLNTKREE